MRVGTLRLLALATAVAGVTTLAVAESPQGYPPTGPYPAPHRFPPPSPYPAPAPYPHPGLPKDPLGNLFPLPIPLPDAETRALLLEGADKLLQALDRMIQTVPVYDPPVVTPEGDIILRRRNPVPEPPPVLRRLPPPATPGPSPWPPLPPGPPIDRTTI